MLRPSQPNPAGELRNDAAVLGLQNAASLVADALRAGREVAQPGATTIELSRAIGEAAIRAGGQALFPGYRQGNSPPFPAEACVSLNEEVVHGVPGNRRLVHGDLVSIDFGVMLDGWCGDSATSFVVGTEGAQIDDPLAQRRAELIQATEEVLSHAIHSIEPGAFWSKIALELERHTARLGYAVVHEYVGHGIGRVLHEPPKVPAYWTGFTGVDFILRPGMVIAIEPLLTELPDGSAAQTERTPRQCPVRLERDGWTVSTESGVDACHCEAMVVVTSSGAERLTPLI